MNDALAQTLTDIGLTRNEALAYVTLVEEATDEGLTGYEVAARSGIPRSAVYNVLRRLERSGGAFATGQRPARYLPTAPERFVRAQRDAAERRFDAAEEALAALPKRATPEPVWVLSRYDEVLERADAMIRGAHRSVWASLWPREVDLLHDALCTVGARGLKGVLHSPASLQHPPTGLSVWDDPQGQTMRAGWAHRVLLVVDGDQVLLGGAEPDADNHAVWTHNPSVVDVATQHLVLDLTLQSVRTGRPCQEVVIDMLRTELRPAHTHFSTDAT